MSTKRRNRSARRYRRRRKPNYKPLVIGLVCLLIGGGIGYGVSWHWSKERTLKYQSLMYSLSKKTTPSRASSQMPASKKTVSKPAPVQAPLPPPPAAAPAPEVPAQAYVSIVLDDWGYNMRAFDWLERIDEPLTIAVLPHLPYTHRIANQAHAAGHEIILHMPMEPDREIPLEQNTLLVGMSREEIQRILNDAIADVPHLVGFSNHMGSGFTADEYSMQAVMEVASGKRLIFLDSLTGPSVIRSVAQQHQMTYLARDIFLDNEYTESYIRGQLNELVETALARGHAIAIGHDHPVTLQTIHDMLPEFRAKGIQIVKLSTYARRRQSDP